MDDKDGWQEPGKSEQVARHDDDDIYVDKWPVISQIFTACLNFCDEAC